ncbi:MAG: DNA-binding response regulator [Bacteroidetes bacterium]|nr:MAG: DNA-binding response regulator [Bacteroidota bacterium]
MEKTRILYVEDEPYLAKIVKESLETRGFEVLWVNDGQAALPAFRSFQPDICVLDVMLPHKDGFTLGAEIRALQAGMPIIFLTAKNQTADVLKGFRSGGNDYVRKPFSLEELIARIQNILRLRQHAAPGEVPDAPIHIGQYIFHPKKLELIRAGQSRKLSHRETQLLKILSAHRNRAVQRKDILKAVWGDDSFFNSRNLDVYITKLRDYLKDDPKVQIITLKGVGYHFVVE